MTQDIALRNNATSIALNNDFEPEVALERGLKRGMILVAVLVVGIGGLSALLPMAGAVIAAGSVSVAGHVKEIAHPTGGVISEVYVRDGDHVDAGDLLMKLDDRVSGASAQYTGENVNQLLARAARLAAERDNAGGVSFPQELASRASDPDIARLMSQERQTFTLRRQSRMAQIAQLRQRIRQAQNEAAGYRQQAIGYGDQARLINEELEVTRDLYRDRYTTLDRLNALERSSVGLRSSAENARTSARTAGGRVGELQAQISSVRQDARSVAASELMDMQTRISDLRRLKVAADDSYDRSTLTAPHAGVVDKLAFTTIGGVVPSTQTILEIVPDNDQFVVDVRIPVTGIDDVHIGQQATLRFSAFSAQSTPEIDGEVTYVAADRTVEERTGAAYYRATVSLEQAQLDRLGSVDLRPGMPVEAFIQTTGRTMLSYLVRPITEQLRRAFREN